MTSVTHLREAWSASRDFGLAWAAGLVMTAWMVWLALSHHLPIRDPDNLIPGYIRFPGIVLLAVLADIVPRVAWRSRGRLSAVTGSWRAVVTERWPASHVWFALTGAAAWYVCYASFRNVKSMAPFVNTRSWDDRFDKIDKTLFLGHHPSDLMHQWLGTGWAAHLFSAVYIVWIALVPVSIAIALVWTRARTAGAWYVTAVALDWLLGAVSYVVWPTVGPIYSDPSRFADLPETYVSRLQASMLADRQDVLADPFASDSLQTIAAFASLHVGIMVTICLIVHYVGMPRWVRLSAWVFLALTVLATVYLGWHFLIDAVAGAALGSAAVWIAAIATGNHVRLRPRLQAPAEEREPVASISRP